MTISIAIAGKGGIGKTTLSALLVRALKEAGIRPILAVDADPNSNLAETLGVEPGRTLADVREVGSSPEGSPPSGIGRVRAVEDELQRAIIEDDGFDLITMGRPEGPRCYCAVNNFLRKSLDSLARNYAAIVVDNEAGMEHISRRTTNNVDFLLIVMNPTLPSARAAGRILALSHELPVIIGRRLLLVNRLGPEGMPQGVDAEIAGFLTERLPDVPQDADLEREGIAGRDVFRLPAHNPALMAVRNVVKELSSTAAVVDKH